VDAEPLPIRCFVDSVQLSNKNSDKSRAPWARGTLRFGHGWAVALGFLPEGTADSDLRLGAGASAAAGCATAVVDSSPTMTGAFSVPVASARSAAFGGACVVAMVW
jgi:hypothetical protein